MAMICFNAPQDPGAIDVRHFRRLDIRFKLIRRSTMQFSLFLFTFARLYWEEIKPVSLQFLSIQKFWIFKTNAYNDFQFVWSHLFLFTWKQQIHVLNPPDRLFHTFKVSKSWDRRFLYVQKRRETDFEGANLWKCRSGSLSGPYAVWYK